MPRLTAITTAVPVTGPQQPPSPFWWLRHVPTLVFTVIVVWLLLQFGRVALVPLLASFGIAYVLNPIVEWLQVRGLGRTMAAFAALLLVTLVLALFAFFVIPDLWHQASDAGGKIYSQMTPANGRAARVWLRENAPMLDRLFGSQLYQAMSNPQTVIKESTQLIAGSLTDFLAAAVNLLDLFLVPFFVFYILCDFPKWRTSADTLVPPRFRLAIQRLTDEIGRILQSYVLGQLLIGLVMGGLYAAGFVALGVPAWAGLAVLSGFLNVVPYVGTGAGIVLASALTYSVYGSIWRVLGVWGVFATVQMIEGYYLTPRILGGRLQLHPMAVFLGLLAGGKLFGFLGILLAVPFIAITTVFLKLARELYLGTDFYNTHAPTEFHAPDALPEERLAKATETVLADQVDKQSGDELLAPVPDHDDPAAREQALRP